MTEIEIRKGCFGESFCINDEFIEVERSQSFAETIYEFGEQTSFEDLGTCEQCGDWNYTTTYNLSDEYAELIFKLYNINLDEK